MPSLLLRCSFVIGILAVIGCQKKAPESTAGGVPDLISKGKSVYQTNCTACHAPDPKVAGALGPDIAHSSLELIEVRVLRAEYPKDYKPKRTSKVMQALPHLKADIPALHAYLNSL